MLFYPSVAVTLFAAVVSITRSRASEALSWRLGGIVSLAALVIVVDASYAAFLLAICVAIARPMLWSRRGAEDAPPEGWAVAAMLATWLFVLLYRAVWNGTSGLTDHDRAMLAGAGLLSIGLVGVMVRRETAFLLLSVGILLDAAALTLVVAGQRWGQSGGAVAAVLRAAVALDVVVARQLPVALRPVG